MSVDLAVLRVEAAHYALLRRLAPSLAHRLMGTLQPIALLTELASRQIANNPPDLERIRDAIAKARQQTRDAALSTSAILSWITDEEAPTIELVAGLTDCVALVRTDSEVRGVRINNAQSTGIEARVSRRALRTLLTASIIATVDLRPSPSSVDVSAGRERNAATVSVDARFLEPDALDRNAVPAERLLTWEDVQAIAAAEGVAVERSGHPVSVRLRFPLLS
jgi:hypothetical protein